MESRHETVWGDQKDWGGGMSVKESGRLQSVFNTHVYFCNHLPRIMHILNEIFENF